MTGVEIAVIGMSGLAVVNGILFRWLHGRIDKADVKTEKCRLEIKHDREEDMKSIEKIREDLMPEARIIRYVDNKADPILDDVKESLKAFHEIMLTIGQINAKLSSQDEKIEAIKEKLDK